MDLETKEESSINLKTLYAALNEIESILDVSHDSLEYLVEGSASDAKKEDHPQNATITLSMLNSQINAIRRVASNNQNLINSLTGK